MSFGGVGIAVPYLALWLEGRGIDSPTIGLIASSPAFAMLGTTILFGAIADRLSDWRTAIIAGCWIACGLFALLTLIDGPRGIWLVWTLGGLVMMAVVPIADGATLSLVRRRGTHYGPIRALGSLGFIVGLTVGGRLIERFGTDVFVVTLVGAALVRSLASFALPHFSRAASASLTNPEVESRPAATISLVAPNPHTAVLRHRGFLMVLAGAALINSSHAFFYTFGLLHWSRIGIPESVSSGLWSASIVAEVLLLFSFSSVARRASARKCLIFAGLVAIGRWALTSIDPPLALLFVLQTTHSISFGLVFIATVSFIARRADDSIAARAQALSATLTTGCMAMMTLASGPLYDALGRQTYLVMAAVCVAGVGFVIASFRTDLEDQLVTA